jgi:CheY-like chemotaxis protein
MSAELSPNIHERLISAKKNTLRAQETSRKLHSLARGDNPDAALIDDPAPGTIVPMPITGTNGASSKSATAHPRVMILDDEEAICALVSAVLSAQGAEVTEATNSTKALQACEQAARDGRPYDVVIADFTLPGDLDGPEIVKRMRAITPGLKAVISSGHDKDEIMVEYRRHGFDAALAKPYELHKLGRVVREILEANGTGSRKTA